MSKQNRPKLSDITDASHVESQVEGQVEGQAEVEGASTSKKSTGGGVSIVLPNGMKRAEYIRQEFAKGRKRGEIAKELGVVYQIVFAATKGLAAVAAPAAEVVEAAVASE